MGVKDCREEEECSVALRTACPQGWFRSVAGLLSAFRRFYPWGSGRAGLSPMRWVLQPRQEPGCALQPHPPPQNLGFS